MAEPRLADISTVTVFLDESGTHGTAERMYVGAVVAPGAGSQLALAVQQAIDDTLADPYCWESEGQRKSFEREGFHFTRDSFTVRERFMKAVPAMNFRTHVVYAYNGLVADGAVLAPRPDMLVGMYSSLLLSLMRRYHRSKMTFVFEENSSLNKLYARIVAETLELLVKNNFEVPIVEVFIGSKEIRELSVVDYMLATVREAFEGDPARYMKTRYYNFGGHIARMTNFASKLSFVDRAGIIFPAAPLRVHVVGSESLSEDGSKYVSSHNAPEVQHLKPFAYVSTLDQLRRSIGISQVEYDELVEDLAGNRAYISVLLRNRRRPRWIQIPASEILRNAQRRILHTLKPAEDDLPSYVHGYVQGRSSVTNATAHAGNRWMQGFDIESFFESLAPQSIRLAMSQLGIGDSVAEGIFTLITVDDHLPVGACTSPLVSNLAFLPIDEQMVAVADKLGLTYTRYADDLTFSGSQEFDIRDQVQEILGEAGLNLNPTKTRTVKHGQSLYVTGLSTTDASRPRLPKKFKRQLRADVYYSRKFGIEDHADRLGLDPVKASRQLRGRIQWAASVEPDILSKLYPGLVTRDYSDTAREASLMREAQARRSFIIEKAATIRRRKEATAPKFVR